MNVAAAMRLVSREVAIQAPRGLHDHGECELATKIAGLMRITAMHKIFWKCSLEDFLSSPLRVCRTPRTFSHWFSDLQYIPSIFPKISQPTY